MGRLPRVNRAQRFYLSLKEHLGTGVRNTLHSAFLARIYKQVSCSTAISQASGL